ncbi:MAG: DUF3267 domain-containing protein [Bacteroidales bacterium]
MAPPVLLLYLVPFILIWDTETLVSDILLYIEYSIPVIPAGIIMHELLHGAGWSLFTQKGFKSVKFGFNWKFLAPYCHCREPLKVKHYITGTLMPLVILGVLPALLAIALGNGALLIFGIIFTWTAGGDIISLFMLRNLESDSYVFDHPDKMGFYTRNDEPAGKP